MTHGEEAVAAILEILNEEGIHYMLVGSFSSNAYGEARATKDADFVVQLDSRQRGVLFEKLPSDFKVDQQVLFETITGHTRQILTVDSIPFEIELFDLSNEPFDQSRFQRRLKTRMLEQAVWLPTPEDVIVQKLRWSKLGNRLKDFVDAQGIVKVRKEKLDWAYIEHWCGNWKYSKLSKNFAFLCSSCEKSELGKQLLNSADHSPFALALKGEFS